MRLKLFAPLWAALLVGTLFTGAQAQGEGSETRNYLFGYTGVEENLAHHLGEIESNQIPTNVVGLTVNAASDDLSGPVRHLASRGQKALIVLDKLLFINDPKLQTPCGANSFRARSDYKAKFDNWLAINRGHINAQDVAALVLNTEVNNRCISADSLDEVTRHVKLRAPDVHAIAVYDQSAGAAPLPEVIPASLGGVGFFKYRVLDPRTDESFQSAYALLKSRLKPEQRILLIADGFYDSTHAALGWPKWYLGHLALNYMDLVLNDPRADGLIIFRWASWEESLPDGTKVGFVGSRALPQNVRDRHRLTGCGLKIQAPLAIPCS